MWEKQCRTCNEYYNGRCYSTDFCNSIEEDFNVNNFRVAESGLLSETVLEFIENYLTKHKDEYSLEYYLALNYKMSNKRILEISGKVESKVIDFVRKFSKELMDEISDLYEEYEEGNLVEKPPTLDKEGVAVARDFCCKYWR